MFGEGSRVAVVASTADAAGNAFLVVKLLTGRLLIDGDELEGIGIALVGISPDGSFLWHPVFLESEDPAAVSPMTLSADGTGNLWMSGLIADAGDIGRGPEANVGRSMFLAQYTGDAGSLLQASVFPAPDANIWGVTITSDGLAVAGDFQGSLTFPNEETLTSVDRHGYVSEVTAAGQYSCVGEILGTSCRADSILYDAQNDALLVAGTFQGALDMDPATFTAGSDQDGFVLALAGCAPFPSLAVQLPHELTRMRAVALDAETALAAGTMNALSGIEDVYLAVIDRGGLSQEVFLGGGESQDILVGLAAVSSEQTAAVAAGTFDAASTLGGSQLEVSGGPDSFLAGVAVDGSVTWVETLSGPGGENVQTLASVPGTNVVYAAGSFDDSVTIGETELLAAEPLGLFLYRKISPP